MFRSKVMSVLSKPGSENPIVSRCKSRHSAVGGGISKMPSGHHQHPGWGFFGFNVMFRPPLDTLPRFSTNFQLSGVLHRGEGQMTPSCQIVRI